MFFCGVIERKKSKCGHKIDTALKIVGLWHHMLVIQISAEQSLRKCVYNEKCVLQKTKS